MNKLNSLSQGKDRFPFLNINWDIAYLLIFDLEMRAIQLEKYDIADTSMLIYENALRNTLEIMEELRTDPSYHSKNMYNIKANEQFPGILQFYIQNF